MDIYYLSIAVANCKYTVSINDFTLFKDDDGYQLHTEIAINQLIFGPLLSINAKLLPIQDKDSLTEIALFSINVIVKNRELKSESILFEYNFNEPKQQLPEFIFNKQLPVSKQNYTPAWYSADFLELRPKLLTDLIAGYNNIWSLLESGDLNGLIKSVKLREETYADSHGLSMSDRLNLSLSTYQSHINDSDYTLYPFEPEHFHPKLQCFGKVISLEDEDGFHPVFFLKNDRSGAINIPLYFSMVNDELKVVL